MLLSSLSQIRYKHAMRMTDPYVGFPNIIHAIEIINQNYSVVPRILLDRSKLEDLFFFDFE